MSQRELQRRVSQKLLYARWHLAWAAQGEYEQQQRDALLESAVWHGLCAYRAFLAEIAADEHLPVATPGGLPQDANTLGEAYPDYLPPALAECANLERGEGWLPKLISHGNAAQGGIAGLQQAPRDNLIGSSGNGLEGAALEHWLEELERLIERLRGDMLEC